MLEKRVLFLILCSIVCVNVRAKISYRTVNVATSRATIYNPRIINKICFLKPEAGPCRANILMYYFDPQHRNCSQFRWGGCQGNGNRFITDGECNQTCLSAPNPGRVIAKYCYLNFDYGYCFGSLPRYYYVPKYQICKEKLFSGCGGNKNNFRTMEQCEETCRIGKFKTLPTTLSDRLQKVLYINPRQATTRKSRIQEKPVVLNASMQALADLAKAKGLIPG